jgi:hypothetical protein
MELTGWLFVRGDESIRLVRNRTELVLFIHGPGSLFRRQEFEGEEALLYFQRSLEHQLVADGWELRSTHERRSGSDRRSQTRGADRRRTTDRDGS